MPRPSPSKTAHRCRLTLAIDGVDYRLRPIPGGWSLRKVDDGVTYEVAAGMRCSCPDRTWRRSGPSEACKHERALRAVGLA